jgi:hypothetical protein
LGEEDLVKEKRVWWEHKKHLQGAEYDSEAAQKEQESLFKLNLHKTLEFSASDVLYT